jgi:hypothetical protein
MAWFDKHKPAGESGKTAEEQSKAEMDALIERFGSSIEEKIAKPLREEIGALKAEWEAVKAEASKAPAPKGPTNEDGSPRELTDEEKNRNATQASLAVAIQTNARLTENECISSIPAHWSHLIPKVKEWFAALDFATKAKPDYAVVCKNVVRILIGQEAEGSGLRRDSNGSFFLEDKSTSGDQDSGPLSDPSLTWQQRDANGNVKKTWTASDQLRALDIDPQKFAENVKKGVV